MTIMYKVALACITYVGSFALGLFVAAYFFDTFTQGGR